MASEPHLELRIKCCGLGAASPRITRTPGLSGRQHVPLNQRLLQELHRSLLSHCRPWASTQWQAVSRIE